MKKKGGKDYKFRGRPVDGRGRTIKEALDELDSIWNSRPSLVMHDYGVVELQISMAGTLTVIEVADKGVIDAIEGGDYETLIAFLAEKAGVSVEEMTTLLGRTDEVVATVDRIRPPTDPTFWRPVSGTEPEVVLPTVIGGWAAGAARAQKIDRKKKQKMVALLAQIGQQEGKTVEQISKESHVPKSTIRDALGREKRQREAKVAARPYRKRFDATEERTVLRAYAETGRNAAEVARRLNLADRTVRSIVHREPETVEALWKSFQKEKLLELVEGGLSASAAGRELGIPERTARTWAKKK